MNPIVKLLETIKNDTKTQRFKELDALIETHPTLYRDYEHLKILQQKMVRANAQNKDSKDAKKAYEDALENLLNHPLMSEYLELIEAINDDIKWVTETIESTLNERLGDIHE